MIWRFIYEKGAFKSTNSMIDSEVKNRFQVENLNGTITGKTYTFANGIISPSLNMSGDLPTDGTIEINELGKTQLKLFNSKYCALKRFNEEDIAIFDADDIMCNIVAEFT